MRTLSLFAIRNVFRPFNFGFMCGRNFKLTILFANNGKEEYVNGDNT